MDIDIIAGFVNFFSYYSPYTFLENEIYRAATYFQHECVMTNDYNVINSYLAFFHFPFFYENIIAMRCI